MKHDYSQYTDLQLYALLSQGRREARGAFSVLYDRHAPRVYSYCRRILNDEDKAADALQESFARIYESARQGREVTHLAAFLLRIARNLCLNEKAAKRPQPLDEREFAFHDDQVERRELGRLIDAAIEVLPEELREAFTLREIDGLDYPEIAQVLGINETNARVRVHRAKQRLRAELAPWLKHS